MNPEAAPVFGIGWSPSGRLRRAAFGAARPVLERALGLDALGRHYVHRPLGATGPAFVEWALARLGVGVSVRAEDLDRVPASGPLLVVANHPFGGVEGLALARTLARVRPDVRLLANALLARLPEIRDLLLLVDPFDLPSGAAVNVAGLRRALAWLTGGGALIVFPAGEVASLDWRRRRIADPAWSGTVAGLARRSGAATLPVFVPGANGALFQAAGVVHEKLRTALLPRELLARSGSTIELRLGSPVPASRLAAFGSDAEAIAYLRERTEILRERIALPRPGAMQPRRTPPQALPVVPPVPVAALAADIAALPAGALLFEADDAQVFVAGARSIPAVLREIGRLRELTFRDVGEGTGREIDLDAFDDVYRHLFVWNRATREVVGAYRLGATDERLAADGIAGLYTASLFRFDPRLFDAMGPALEMGRSWIRTEHQRSYAPLLLLWKGIGRYVVRHPRYVTLFGPVSISAEYRSMSQKIIVAFLERNRRSTEWARWVRPTNPFRESRRPGVAPGPAHLRDLEDVSTFISEIEADQKGVPVLLKQYLKLDGRLLGYNVDPAFSNVLDVLIAVDLRRTDTRILERYMGRDGAARFREAQAV